MREPEQSSNGASPTGAETATCDRSAWPVWVGRVADRMPARWAVGGASSRTSLPAVGFFGDLGIRGLFHLPATPGPFLGDGFCAGWFPLLRFFPRYTAFIRSLPGEVPAELLEAGRVVESGENGYCLRRLQK